MSHSAHMPALDPAAILVAVPTLNEALFIEKTLSMLMAPFDAINSFDMSKVQIVVSDGGSTDGTQDIVEAVKRTYPNVNLIHNPDGNQSSGVNLAVKTFGTSGHKYIVRVDAHAEYPPGYVYDIVRSMQTQDASAVATVIDSIGMTCFQKSAAWAIDTIWGTGGAGHRGGHSSGWVDHGHHAGFTMDIWRKTGGYDAEFDHNEDGELDARIAAENGSIWLDADIRLKYFVRPTLSDLAKQYWRYGRGRARTLNRHRTVPRVRQLIPPIVVLLNFGAVLFLPITVSLIIFPALYFLFLALVTFWSVCRQRSVCGLWAGPVLFVVHMWWGMGFLWQCVIGKPRAA